MITNRVRAPLTDRILPVTRLVAALIVPFLVVAFVILYLLPDETGRLFAWTVEPPMNALLMGAGYIAGAYFFVRTATAKRWHHVAAGFLPVTSFASLLMVATLLHWDCFNHGHVSFITWVAIYATTPFIVLALWLRNRLHDPGLPDADDARISRSVRLVMAGVGALLLGIGALLFLRPTWFIPIWPWQLTMPLAARALGAWFVLPGVLGLTIARDPRWSAARLALQSQLIGILLILVAALRARSDFDLLNPLTWIFVIGMGALGGGIALLCISMERRQRGVVSNKLAASKV